ncbi:MAG: transglutaminaseTgpA domain-containing protein [Ilumatobacteraceae bacterium]
MTATLTREAAPAADPNAAARPPATPPARPARSPGAAVTLDVVATIGLAVYSTVAALGLSRVFGDGTFVGDVIIIVAVGHGISLALRLLRVPVLVAVLATLLALVWTVGYLHYPETYGNLLPSMATWDVASADVALVRQQFRDAVAPVAYVGGWALLASIGTAFVVFASDLFAFRANGRGEALVPGAVLFVFVAALGVDEDRIGLTLALVAAGFLAAALLRARATPPPRTLLGRRRLSLATILPATIITGGLVVLAAWVIGPRLPGAADEPLIDTRQQNGGVTEVGNPLVDIRARLVNQSASQMFSINATAPAYWRVTALPAFDGDTWGLPERAIEDVDGQLQAAATGAIENRQEITVAALTGRLVPAAAEPIAASDAGLRWSAETSTLVRTDRPLERGDRFEVVSAVPVITPDQLRATGSTAPPDPMHLELPGDFPESVRQQALVLAAGAATPYDVALAMQNWFRTEFRYSTEIPQGHGNDAIQAFLRQRAGYCEQFAGTMAAMARSLNIPARVAVGFTPGLVEANGTRSVLGRNAHAWPELWFDGIGWVPFEPTPGRGAPGTESYTGVAPAQDETVPTPSEAAAEAEPATPATTLPATPPSVPAGDLIETAPPAPVFPPIVGTVSGPAIGRIVVLGLVALGVVTLGAPPLVRRWRRRHPNPDPAVQVNDLWVRAMGAVEATGYRVDRSLTPLEQARAAAPRLPVAARPLRSLAHLTTQATFSPADEVALIEVPTAPGEGGPRRWCRQVERIATDSMTPGGRARRYFTIWK